MKYIARTRPSSREVVAFAYSDNKQVNNLDAEICQPRLTNAVPSLTRHLNYRVAKIALIPHRNTFSMHSNRNLKTEQAIIFPQVKNNFGSE